MAKKNVYLKEAKDTMKVGATAMVGHGVLGSLRAVPGMPAAAGQTANIAGAGLTLATTGQLAKSGVNIVKSITPKQVIESGKKSKDKFIKRIL